MCPYYGHELLRNLAFSKFFRTPKNHHFLNVKVDTSRQNRLFCSSFFKKWKFWRKMIKMMITPSVWAFYFFIFLFILWFHEVGDYFESCRIKKKRGNLDVKHGVAFLRKKKRKNVFYVQKGIVIDSKVWFCWKCLKFSRVLLGFAEIVTIATVVMI